MKRITYNYNGQTVYLEVTRYANSGMLAVIMFNVNGEPYGVITVNLCSLLQSYDKAFIDENNIPGIGEWLVSNNIAEPLNVSQNSGYCSYPLYKFNYHI